VWWFLNVSTACSTFLPATLLFVNFQSRIFHPLLCCPSFSSPAFSTPATLSVIFQSCIFQPSPALLSVIFQSCNFHPLKFLCPSFSCPVNSAPHSYTLHRPTSPYTCTHNTLSDGPANVRQAAHTLLPLTHSPAYGTGALDLHGLGLSVGANTSVPALQRSTLRSAPPFFPETR